MAGSITHWLYALRSGDDDSVNKLWNRWRTRLCKKLAPNARRLAICDEEDVANGAFYDLCDSIKKNRHPEIDNRNELWRLLYVIANRKASDWSKYDSAQKRGGGTISNSPDVNVDMAVDKSGQLPDLNAQFADDFGNLMHALYEPELKELVHLKLSGYNNAEIARKLDCSLRTVQYMLKKVRDIWTARTTN